ncbi:MAG: hypothetical protein Q8L27_04940 [archaeon]|nr:hypothetical protein [archaeon]
MDPEKQKIKEQLLKMKEKHQDIDTYLDEVICCLDNDCKKSVIILLWSVFLFFLYKKIEEFGLKEFEKFCKDKFNLQGKINQAYDINKIKDRDLLFACRELGFYDLTVENQLINLLGLRNNCAHVSQLIVTPYQLFGFIEQTINYTDLINKLDFKKMPKSFFDELKKMEDEKKIAEIISSMEIEKLKNYAEQCLHEILFISNSKDYQNSKGLYLFLSLLIENREKDEEKVLFFEMILPKVFKKEFDWRFTFIEKFADYSSYSAIKKIILDKYLDNVVNLFLESGTFKTAGQLCKVLLNFKRDFNSEQLRAIGNAYLSNNQITHAYGVNPALKIIFNENKEKVSTDLISALKEKGLDI